MFKLNSLLLYKNRPGRLVAIGDRIEVELDTGEVVKVRPKDVTMLHPGPLASLADLKPQQGEMVTAWEILSGGQTRLGELAELAYGAYTPATAWAAWQQVAEGEYFTGTPDFITARTIEEVEQRKREREQAAAEKNAWQEFLVRLKKGQSSGQTAFRRVDRECESIGIEQILTDPD